MSNKPDPNKLTIEQLLDTLEASNGFLVVVINGIGIGTFYWYNPGRDGFEQIESRSSPERTEDGQVRITTETMNHGIFSRKNVAGFLESHWNDFGKAAHMEFIRYPDSPFPQSGTPDEWGGVNG